MENNRVSRPLLLTGLIVALIMFVLLTIGGIITMIALPAAMDAAGLGDTGSMGEAVLLISMFIVGVIAVFAILGIIFSAISISRWNLPPEEFDKKMAAELLKDRRTYVPDLYSQKKGRTFAAYLCLDTEEGKASFRLEFPKKKNKK